jgi:hypothetical protein
LLSNFSVRDTSKIPLSKEINYFKKSRDIETNLEKTFYQKFINQLEITINVTIDSEEDNIIYEDGEIEISIYNEEEAAEHLDFNEDNNSIMSQNSNLDGNSSPSNDDLMVNPFNNNTLMMNNNSVLNQNSSNFLEGFSHLKSEELKSYLDSFGEGKREFLHVGFNDFKNFSRKLENLDKWKFTNLEADKDKGNSNLYKDKSAKPKKVQVLFDFSKDKEIIEEEFEELFESKESKAKKLRELNNQNNINIRRENTKIRDTKKFYNFGMRV